MNHPPASQPHTDARTDRQTDRQTLSHTHTRTHTHTHTHTDTQTHRHTHDPLSVYFFSVPQVIYRVRCASGLHYNPITKHCDWPSNVHCVNVHGGSQPTSAAFTQPPSAATTSWSIIQSNLANRVTANRLSE